MTARKWTVLIVLLLAGILGTIGCAPIHTLTPDFEQRKPRSIAILPVLNETVDLDAPQVMLPMIHSAMLNKGYEVIGPEETKILLAKENIHEAGQMFSLTYAELGKLLGAKALLYCTVTDWSSLYLLVYSSVTVEAKFELIEAGSGKRLWEAKYKSSRRRVATDQESLQRTLFNAAFAPYEPRARVVIYRCLATLPNGPYYVAPKRRGCLGP